MTMKCELNIKKNLLKEEGAASWLGICDTDGYMALNIAANEAKRS